MHHSQTARLVAEFIGTFTLIFIGAGAGALGIGGLVGVSFAFGLVIVTLAYAYGSISGCHINPAVTVGAFVAGAISAGEAVLYIIVQLAGGIAGAAFLFYVLGGNETGLGATALAVDLPVGDTLVTITPTQGVLLEGFMTFLLVNAVIHCAIAGRAGNLAPLAIGLTLTLAILMGGPLTGGSLNPARTLGPAVMTGDFTDIWVYIVGPVGGALVAALLYRGLLKS